MTRDGAINYANKVLNKLEGVRNRASGATIHDALCHIAVLKGYIRFMDTQTPRVSDDTKLANLREAITDAECFLVRRAEGR